jgi:hypothetical protein
MRSMTQLGDLQQETSQQAMDLLQKYFAARTIVKSNVAKVQQMQRSGISVPEDIRSAAIADWQQSNDILSKILDLDARFQFFTPADRAKVELGDSGEIGELVTILVLSAAAVAAIVGLAVVITKSYVATTATERALVKLEQINKAKAEGTISTEQAAALENEVVTQQKNEATSTSSLPNVLSDLSGLLKWVAIVGVGGALVYMGWPLITKGMASAQQKARAIARG